jgi:hypothetical protein
MLGPTVSLLPALPGAVVDALAGVVTFWAGCVGIVAGALAWRGLKVSGSRLPKNGVCTAIGPPD